MTPELTNSDLEEIEHLLKKDLAKRMGAIQQDRISGPAGSRNVGNARSYVEHARTLRKILKERGRQGYVPLHSMSNAREWLNDEVEETAGIGVRDDLGDVVEKLHRISNPHFDPETMTDHDNVPGRPA